MRPASRGETDRQRGRMARRRSIWTAMTEYRPVMRRGRFSAFSPSSIRFSSSAPCALEFLLPIGRSTPFWRSIAATSTEPPMPTPTSSGGQDVDPVIQQSGRRQIQRCPSTHPAASIPSSCRGGCNPPPAMYTQISVPRCREQFQLNPGDARAEVVARVFSSKSPPRCGERAPGCCDATALPKAKLQIPQQGKREAGLYKILDDARIMTAGAVQLLRRLQS